MIVKGTWDENPPEEPGAYVIALNGTVIEVAIISVVKNITYIRPAHCVLGTEQLQCWIERIHRKGGYYTTWGASTPAHVKLGSDGLLVRGGDNAELVPLQYYKIEFPPLCYQPTKETK